MGTIFQHKKILQMNPYMIQKKNSYKFTSKKWTIKIRGIIFNKIESELKSEMDLTIRFYGSMFFSVFKDAPTIGSTVMSARAG